MGLVTGAARTRTTGRTHYVDDPAELDAAYAAENDAAAALHGKQSHERLSPAELEPGKPPEK